MPKFLFLSIKPEYANKILNKQKTIELRKNRPNVKTGDYVLIYATVPVKAVIGLGKVKSMIDTTPLEMWENRSAQLGIDQSAFDLYYLNSHKAIGIELESICKFKIVFPLSEIKKLYPKFSPPQTYRYISFFETLRTYKLISMKS
jgi:predicted transcriptional regulator